MESDIKNEFDLPSDDDIPLEQAERIEYNNNKDTYVVKLVESISEYEYLLNR
uniref:Uncharacterized protein n=1 Tax=Rhizophagus irregularis (strain DAOM 181602 / DAOM 197198 / MUCL 43194) TaxID=747089 RepID=U9UNJ3_RHIID